MYDVIKVTLDAYQDSVGNWHPYAYAQGINKKARSNSTKWHKGEHIEVGTVDQEADQWYEALLGHTFKSPQDNDEIAPCLRYFSISNYRKKGKTLPHDTTAFYKNATTTGAKTLLTIWEVEPGQGAISGPVYLSGSKARKVIRMLTGHKYKMHNED